MECNAMNSYYVEENKARFDRRYGVMPRCWGIRWVYRLISGSGS